MHTPTESAIEIVKDHCEYLRNVSTAPFSFFYPLTKEEWENENISYSIWITTELLHLLKQTPDIPPLIIIEKLRDKMYKYSTMNPRTSFIFLTACQTLDDIICIMVTQ